MDAVMVGFRLGVVKSRGAQGAGRTGSGPLKTARSRPMSCQSLAEYGNWAGRGTLVEAHPTDHEACTTSSRRRRAWLTRDGREEEGAITGSGGGSTDSSCGSGMAVCYPTCPAGRKQDVHSPCASSLSYNYPFPSPQQAAAAPCSLGSQRPRTVSPPHRPFRTAEQPSHAIPTRSE